MKMHARYTYADLESIFDETDALIAPSVWYETFGYTVLEALSFGVPVIVSSTVGAKDMIPEGCGIIFGNSENDLERTLEDLTKEKLVLMNQNIMKHVKIHTVSEMNAEIMEKCYF